MSESLLQQCNMWLLSMTCRFMCNISMNFNAVLAAHLLHDSFLIIIPEWTAKFIIVHSWPVFLNAPTPGHLPPKQNYIVVLSINLSTYSIEIVHSLITSNQSKTQPNQRGKSYHNLNFLCSGLLFKPGMPWSLWNITIECFVIIVLDTKWNGNKGMCLQREWTGYNSLKWGKFPILRYTVGFFSPFLVFQIKTID